MNRTLLYLSLTAIILAIMIFSGAWLWKRKFSADSKMVRDTLKSIENLEKKYVGKYIVDQTCYYNSDPLRPLQFERIYHKASLLISLPKNTCWPCVYHIITFLEEVNQKYMSDSSVIFISSEDNIYYDSLEKDVIMLNSLGIENSLEENHLFLFQLDTNGKLTSLHIVTNLEMKRTQKYIQGVYGCII